MRKRTWYLGFVLALASLTVAQSTYADDGNAQMATKFNTEFLANLLKPAQENSLSAENEGADAPIVAPAGSDLNAIRQRIREHDRLSRQIMLAGGKEKQRLSMQMAAKGKVEPTGVTMFDPKLAENGAVFVAFTAVSRDWCTAGPVSWGYCHASVFDKSQYKGRVSDYALLTANKKTNSGGNDGAKYENISYWNSHSYSEVREMTVSVASTSVKNAAVIAARGYAGPYAVMTPVWSNSAWYCSKVVWRAYFDASNWIMLSKPTVVTPGDIRWSPFTRTVRTYS